mgnify:CR=1 FL=1
MVTGVAMTAAVLTRAGLSTGAKVVWASSNPDVAEVTADGIVVPTGYSFNLDGTSIYLSMAVVFLAQAFRVDLSIGQQIMPPMMTETTWPSASRSGRYAHTNSRTRWRVVVTLENDVLQVTVLPQLGGRIWSIIHLPVKESKFASSPLMVTRVAPGTVFVP